MAKLRTFKNGEHIYTLGDRPNGVFGIIEGRLALSIPRADGEAYTAHRAGKGFWVGDLALFSKRPRLLSAQATEPVLAVHLPPNDLTKLIREDPRLYEDFYELTYENMQLAFQLISNLAISSSTKRLADRLLLELAAHGNDQGFIPVSQSELATSTSISLPTLKRALARFAAAGVIKRQYGRIQILRPDALLRLCKR